MKFLAALLAVFALAIPTPPAAAAPEAQMTWAVHVSLAPTWFDPAETPGIVTPFMVLYALHDALVKPMPASAMAPSLAESWSASPTGSPTSSSCARACGSTTATRHRRGREVLLRALSRGAGASS